MGSSSNSKRIIMSRRAFIKTSRTQSHQTRLLLYVRHRNHFVKLTAYCFYCKHNTSCFQQHLSHRISCSICQNALCNHCGSIDHFNMTCEEYQLALLDTNGWNKCNNCSCQYQVLGQSTHISCTECKLDFELPLSNLQPTS